MENYRWDTNRYIRINTNYDIVELFGIFGRGREKLGFEV
jgi:hypothetical protein